jgi:hypothetical protein
LVERKSARDENVEVNYWNQSELVRRLEQNPDLKPVFFGPEQDPMLVKLDRLVKSGGKLETGEDLVERARTLSEFAQRRDVDFDCRITSGPPTAPAPKWDELPFMTPFIGDERTEVQVSAFVREGADVPLPTLRFVDTEQGRQARSEAVRSLARGEKALVTGGARLAIHAPQVMRDLTGNQSAVSSGPVELQPGEPVALELEVETEEGTVHRQLEMRPVPPRPGVAAAFAGYTGSMLLELGFVPLAAPTIRANISFSVRFGQSAAANAEAAQLLYAFYTHTAVTLRNDLFWPDAGELRGHHPELHEMKELADMEWRRRLYANVAVLEERLGVALPEPTRLTMDDINGAATAAGVLRTGGGTHTFRRAEVVVEEVGDISALWEASIPAGLMRRMVTYTIFGREVALGEADYELPLLKAEVIAVGEPPHSSARVVFEPTAPATELRFRLVDWEPAADQQEQSEPGGPPEPHRTSEPKTADDE